MDAQIYKIVSETKNTMQVVILALVQYEFPSGKKQIRKVSITRHLHKEGDKWIGWTPMKDWRDKNAVRIDFTDAVKKRRKANEEPQGQAA
jgi:hypothetical protein